MTDPRLFERARALFDRVCDLDVEAREVELADSDHETATLVRELLAADAASGARLDASPVRELGERRDSPRVPERIGSFTIQERLGAGTTGVVYRARQDSPVRDVAIKVVRSAVASADTLRRFVNEAEVLARLDHPGIAKVFEAGATDMGHGPEPWFAMELVDGVPLVRYVRERALARDAIVRLVADVADAVHHAHVRGVVHRDLKPANVLVGPDGRPKVLDFGLARTVAADASLDSMHTRTGDVLGTLAYMSPEQLLGGAEVDAQSDVYALGVLAYEALCGSLPLDVGSLPLAEAARVVESRDPARLGTRDRELAGDLETVVAKALEKERSRRYASAADFAADLRRVLVDEPIEARPPSAWYQATKFARRNRGFVTGIVSVFAALIAGVVASTSLYLDKEHQREVAVAAKNDADAANQRERDARLAAETASEQERAAREAAERAQKVGQAVFSEFLTLITAATPWSLGEDVLLADAIAAGAENAREAFPEQPLMRAEFLAVFSEAFQAVGDWANARSFAEDALALAQANGADPQRELEMRVIAAAARASSGDGTALGSLREIVRDADALDAQPILRVRAMYELVEQLQYLGNLDECLSICERALEFVPQFEDEQPAAALRMRKAYGDTLSRVGRLEEARRVLAAAAEFASEHDLEFHELMCLNSVANCNFQMGRYQDARDILGGVLERMRGIGAQEHPFYLTQLANFSSIESSLGNHAEASARLRELIELAHRTQAAPSRTEAIALSNLVEVERRRGECEEAARLADRCRPLLTAALGESGTYVTNGAILFGKAYLDAGRVEDAIVCLSSGIAGKRRDQAEDHPTLADDFVWYARALLEIKDFEHAAEAAREAVERAPTLIARNAGLEVISAQTLAIALALTGKTDEALSRARAAVDEARERMPSSWLAPRAEAVLALCEALAGEGEPALARFDEAYGRVLAAGTDPEGPTGRRLRGLRDAASERLSGAR